MIAPEAVEPARKGACSVCGGELDALGRCAKCGAVFGEAYRCPLCQAITDVEPSPVIHLRCRSCGGPRIAPTESPLSAEEITQLRAARAEQLRATAFRTGSWFALASGVFSVFVTSVVLAATAPAPLAKVAALVAALVPFALSLVSFRAAAAHARRLNVAIERAWQLAAARVVQHEGQKADAVELSRLLRTNEAHAEFLLAEVSVQDFVHARVEQAPLADLTELASPELRDEQSAGGTQRSKL